MKKVILSLSILMVLASCTQKASIEMNVLGAPNEKLAIHKLNVSSSELLDSVKTDKNGSFRYSLPVKKGQPEFVYIYKGDTRLASLLLESGDKVKVNADTLGVYSVLGSEESSKLQKVEQEYSVFLNEMMACEDDKSAVKTYISYYRGRTAYVMNNCKSLTVVPVLYQTFAFGAPVFSQPTDAILFRSVCDSLKTVYPESKYVKALEQETKLRENRLGLDITLSKAQEVGFPPLILPDVNSKKVSLAGVDSKVILLHFWSDDDAQQTLFNTEVLMPLYNKYHKKGFEIYSVCISTDKSLWASVVRNQKLPWINVCDGRGVASPAVALYNVSTLPYSLLITDGTLTSETIKGEKQLEELLKKSLN